MKNKQIYTQLNAMPNAHEPLKIIQSRVHCVRVMFMPNTEHFYVNCSVNVHSTKSAHHHTNILSKTADPAQIFKCAAQRIST